MARPAATRHLILGTAGHVDHGKTELVRALTGHDTDRLKEEKERGISIELGFAPLPLAEDVFLGVIDVPGHERFVRQMVAGAGGIDLALLLIAADEGIMPQTVEHVEVLRSLGVRRGVIAISKRDTVDEASLSQLQGPIAALVRGSFLEEAPVVPVSVRSGEGLDSLRAALLDVARGLEVRSSAGPFRLAIDRVFHQKGIGVVVTGSAYSGTVSTGDELELLPGGARARVREIQSFGERLDAGAAGERLALALHGVKLGEVERGDMLATPGRFAATHTVDLRVTIAAHEDGEVRNRARVRVHHGAREVLGRLVLLECDAIHAGQASLAQLRLESPIVAGVDDRVVIRTYSPARVIGGGLVIDPRAEEHRRSDADAIERLRVRATGDNSAVLAKTIERAGSEGVPESMAESAVAAELIARDVVVAVAGRWYDRRVLEAMAENAVELATAHTERNPLQWGIDKEELRQRLGCGLGAAGFNRLVEVLAGMRPLFVRANRVRAGAGEMELSAARETALRSLLARIRTAGANFMSREEAAGAWSQPDRFLDAVQLLKDRGVVVEVGDGLLDRDTLDRCESVVRQLLRSKGELSVGDLKEALGVSRKHAIPLLEHFDATDLTRRTGNTRVAGRRADLAK